MAMNTAGAPRDDREPLELKNPAPPEKEPSGFANVATGIGSRNLMIIIITMPLVFVAVVMAIIAVFGRDDETEIAEAPASTPIEVLSEPRLPQRAATAGALSPTPAGIALSPGAHVAAMALDGDRLAVRVEGPAGAEVVIYDLAAGEVVQRIPIIRGE